MYNQFPHILQKVKKCEDVSREAGDQGHQQDVPPRQVHPAQLSGSFTKTMSNGIVVNTSSTWEIKCNPPLLPGSKRSAVEREGRPSSDRATPAQDPSCFKVRPQLLMSEARALELQSIAFRGLKKSLFPYIHIDKIFQF